MIFHDFPSGNVVGKKGEVPLVSHVSAVPSWAVWVERPISLPWLSMRLLGMGFSPILLSKDLLEVTSLVFCFLI
jgi:hypothetical protein